MKKKNKLIEKLKVHFQEVHNISKIVPDEHAIFSSVAIILREKAFNLQILFIKRSKRDNDTFSGHMAFPGGVEEKTDKDTLSTAIRETLEEVGLDLNLHGKLIGRFDDYRPATPLANHFIVSPFIFYLTDSNFNLIRNPNEVEDVVWIDINELQKILPRSRTSYNKLNGIQQDYVFDYGKYRIWGMTGKILYSFLKKIKNVK